MIFLYEKQKTSPPNCLNEYKICYPLMEAKMQYEFLYRLDLEKLQKIDEIHFLSTDDRELGYYASVLNTYSPDIHAAQNKLYFSQISELRALPSKQFMEDLRKKNFIIGLINKQKFFDIDNYQKKVKLFPSQEYTIFLDYKGMIISGILDSASDLTNFHLFVTYKGMNVVARSGMVRVDTKLYIDTMKKLEIIRRDYTLEGSDYNYEISSFLNVLRNDLLQHILSHSRKSKIKLQLIGSDDMIIDGAAEILLGNKFSDYNLINGVPLLLDNPALPLIFKNFDSLEKPDALNDLYNLVFSLSKVLLHSRNYRIMKKFESFEPVNLLSEDEIKDSLTRIFFSLLQDSNKLISAPGQYFHYYIRQNSLTSLIGKFNQIQDLATIIYQLDIVSIEVLNNNDLMWYFIRKELDEINHKAKVNSKESSKKIQLIFGDNGWKFIGLAPVKDDACFPSMSIYLVAILIFAEQVGYAGIKFDNLRAIIDNLYERKKERENSPNDGSSRDSLKNLLQRFKKINPAFQDMAKKHIICKNGKYWFIPSGNISYVVSHPKLSKEYLQTFLGGF